MELAKKGWGVGIHDYDVENAPDWLSNALSRSLYEIRRELLGEQLADEAVSSIEKPTSEQVFVDMVEQFLIAYFGSQTTDAYRRSA